MLSERNSRGEEHLFPEGISTSPRDHSYLPRLDHVPTPTRRGRGVRTEQLELKVEGKLECYYQKRKEILDLQKQQMSTTMPATCCLFK